jgi:hypothetical protein
MATQEFYIREAAETEARGPFNLEQMLSLIETGGVTEATLFYDAGSEKWVAIGDSPEVKASLYPEKKRLKMKMRSVEVVNRPVSETHTPLTVHDMLAASEGRTADTKDKENPEIGMARAARIGMWAAILTLAVAAIGELLPAADAIVAMDLSKITEQPLAFLGVLDLLLAVLLFLGLVNLYPLVRFRAAVGLGYFGFLFYVHGLGLPLAACIAGAAGLYLETVFVHLFPVMIASLAGIIGSAAVTYYLIST